MIGNDIIDLEVPNSKYWNTKRYLDKLFNPMEQKLIEEASATKNKLQLLWSLKEATYKAHQRRFNLPRKFNPLDFQCEITSENSDVVFGFVKIDHETYYTNTTITPSYIHSIATLDKNQATSVKIFTGKKPFLKELLAEFSLILEEPIINLKIQKNNNYIPILYRNTFELEHAFSPSHHGKYCAFVIALMNS